ncbi:MAG: hypothetical protein PHC63_04340 [Candidatus Bathyarchaeota archaeon]|nr:hypothetical protein [Candidatus Bathyarchaeota archaeon]
MPRVSFRVSEEQKQELLRYGGLSQTLREAVKLYLKSKKSEEILLKLGELQAKNPTKMSAEEIVRSIRLDRDR